MAIRRIPDALRRVLSAAAVADGDVQASGERTTIIERSTSSVPRTHKNAKPHRAPVDALLAKLRVSEDILWLLHVGADPDCVGSAFALREAFGGVIGATGGMNRAGDRLATQLGMSVDPMPRPEAHAIIVAVDTGSASGLGDYAARVPAPLLVDHHRFGDLHEGAPASAWDPARASCAEVVLALLDRAGREPSPIAARGLLAGIVTDTARFRYADAHALATAARLVGLASVRMEDVYEALRDEEEEDSFDARRAALRAAQRAEVEEIHGYLVATSMVGSFDARAANALVFAGADVALVGVERSDLARVSLRGSARVRGVHLGELANRAGRAVGWSAGGHEGAAGMRGAPPLAPAKAALVAELRRSLEAL